MSGRILLTGEGMICAAGKDPDTVWNKLWAGQSAVGQLRSFECGDGFSELAGEIEDFNPQELVPERKLHKLLGRTDFLGLYAGRRAIEDAGLIAHRQTLDPQTLESFNERTAVLVGSGGAAYSTQYEFLPLLAHAAGDLGKFGSELDSMLYPMWLLRSLPNNVLCHLGIRYGFKGHNACVTHHAVSGALALIEAADVIACGQADRAVVVGHEAPIEPQALAFMKTMGLRTSGPARPFDKSRGGPVLGEGAAAVVLESEDQAQSRGVRILGEFLGGACTSEGAGLLPIRADGEGVARAISLALDQAGVSAAGVGLVIAHGNATQQSDAAEACAIRTVFGASAPVVTAFKWAFGHTFAASAILESVLAIHSLRRGEVPGIATLREPDARSRHLRISRGSQKLSKNIAVIISRGFGSMTTALVLRCADGAASQ